MPRPHSSRRLADSSRRFFGGKVSGLALALALAPSLGCLKVPPEETEVPSDEGAPQTAEAVLSRYVTAVGGEEALRKITQRTV